MSHTPNPAPDPEGSFFVGVRNAFIAIAVIVGVSWFALWLMQ